MKVEPQKSFKYKFDTIPVGGSRFYPSPPFNKEMVRAAAVTWGRKNGSRMSASTKNTGKLRDGILVWRLS